jgi:hypothetical protein
MRSCFLMAPDLFSLLSFSFPRRANDRA